MNVFEVSLADTGDGTLVSSQGFEVSLSGVAAASGEYTLGVRPEDFSVVDAGGIEAVDVHLFDADGERVEHREERVADTPT